MSSAEAKQHISESMTEQKLAQKTTTHEGVEATAHKQDPKELSFEEIDEAFRLGVYKERDPLI